MLSEDGVGDCALILQNAEGHTDFNIRPDWHENRKPGLSALIRLRQEATWCEKAIESFLPWVDEAIIVVQPSGDGTREIVEQYASDTVRIFDYPFLTHPAGPGHDDMPANSVHASAYHYNFTLAQCTMSHAVKLDGDLVMMDWAGQEIRALMERHDRIKFEGVDIVGDDLTHIGCHPRCPTDGVFKVTPDIEYRQGPLSQKLFCAQSVTHTIEKPAFLHFKWSRKGEASQTKRWPKDWREKPHFQNIWRRQEPVAPYTGEYPASIMEML